MYSLNCRLTELVPHPDKGVGVNNGVEVEVVVCVKVTVEVHLRVGERVNVRV